MEPTTPLSIHDRITALIEHFTSGNKTAFGRETGLLPGVLASITGGRLSKPSFELLEKIMLRYPEVSGDWLLTGKGLMVVPSAPDRVHVAPVKRAPGSFLPSGYVDPIAEFYAQRPVDLGYVIELVDFIAKSHPSPKLLQFQERLPYTLNPDYDPEAVDPEWEARMDEYNAQQSAEWERQRQERKNQEGQQ